MAEHDQDNEEYRFAELDSLDNESMGNSDSEQYSSPSSGQNRMPGKDIKRNSLIVVGLVILAMVMYKFIGYMFFSEADESVSTKATVPPITQVTPQPAPTSVVTPAPVKPIQQVQETQQIVTQADPEMVSKVSAIEMSQQDLRSEVSALSQQVVAINSNVNNLNAQIANLNQVIGTLSNQMVKQSEVISVLVTRPQPKKVRPVVARYVPQRVKYNIQAVIPGRAWLIGTNGSTITVREGTKIAGYGVVKLIDSTQGRVLTSSGQVIRFSQNDS